MADTGTTKEVNLTDETRADEMLEKCYLYQNESGGHTITIRQICRDMNLTRWEYRRIRAILDRDSFTEQSGDDTSVILTEKGIDQAIRMIRSKNSVSAFLKATCNLTEESALRNASVISSSVSEDVLEGIRNYMIHGHTASRIIRDHDLNVLYEPGQYRFDMSLYETHKGSPRLLCAENEAFSRDTDLFVTASGSSFSMKRTGSEVSGTLWYLYSQKWYEAEQTVDGYRIPSHVFTYTVSGRIPMIAGEIYVAFVPQGTVLKEESIRELEVHLW
ncbi:MAG: hypothetical protein IJ121_06255 [Eubacterium sp.]|nr:hypothetical protein [Eubacterium sp.]